MKDEELDLKEAAELIAKSMYKAVKKAFKAPIADVLDENFVPEAKPTKNPVPKLGVMYKNKKDTEKEKSAQLNKNNKLKNFLDKKRGKNNL